MRLLLAVLLSLIPITVHAEYLGDLSANPYESDSTANPFGAGNPFKPDGINNPYSPFVSPFSNQSATIPLRRMRHGSMTSRDTIVAS